MHCTRKTGPLHYWLVAYYQRPTLILLFLTTSYPAPFQLLFVWCHHDCLSLATFTPFPFAIILCGTCVCLCCLLWLFICEWVISMLVSTLLPVVVAFFFPRRARQSPARKLYYFTFTLPFESLSSSLFSPIVPSDRKASQGLSQFCFPPLLRFYLPCFTLALQSLTLF